MVAVAWACYVLTLLPVLGIFPIGQHAVADRYAYLSSLPPFLLCGLACSRFWEASLASRRFSRVLVAAALAGATALVALSGMTRRQINVWKDTETLCKRILSLDPGNYIAHHNMGTYLLRRERFSEAIPHLRAAVSAKPNFPLARANLAKALEKTGRLREAADQYQRVVELVPIQDDTRYHLAVMLSGLGDAAGAAAHFEYLVKVHPDSAQAWFNLEAIRERQGRSEDAVAAFGRASILDSAWEPPRRRLANLQSKR